MKRGGCCALQQQGEGVSVFFSSFLCFPPVPGWGLGCWSRGEGFPKEKEKVGVTHHLERKTLVVPEAGWPGWLAGGLAGGGRAGCAFSGFLGRRGRDQ